MLEIWKDIKNYENLYQISNFGRVKSFAKHFHKEKILTPILANGYYQIGIRKNSIRKYLKIHRLIAEVFINNPYNKPCINHKDGNKLNNDIDNLEWVTHKENIRHAINIGLRLSWSGDKNPRNKLSKKDVDFIRKSSINTKDLSIMFNVSDVNIYDIKSYKIWK